MNQARARSLRHAALELLTLSEYDLVIMGHSHVAEVVAGKGGTYVNCGCWYSDRTLATLDENGPSLKQWHEGRLIDYGYERVPPTD